MIDENFLIKDERDAIAGYHGYLVQGANPKVVKIIHSIMRDEEKHIRLLNKIKQMKK